MTPNDVKQAREMLGMSTREFADTLLISQRHVQRMEAGKASITARMDRDIRALLVREEENAEILQKARESI